MAGRLLLRKQIIDAWSQCIATDYVRQRINSERSLQASLWSKLNARLDPKNRRMFIEPGLVLPTPKSGSSSFTRRVPDLVVCNTRSVIGVIELKYLPKAKPRWKKDLDTLAWIARRRKRLSIRNKRYRGIEADARDYPFSPSILFVWAGIHAPAELTLANEIPAALRGCFLELHAETSPDGDPDIWFR